jgi:hypothetical protein
LLAQQLGTNAIIIIEKLHEIDIVLQAAKKLGAPVCTISCTFAYFVVVVVVVVVVFGSSTGLFTFRSLTIVFFFSFLSVQTLNPLSGCAHAYPNAAPGGGAIPRATAPSLVCLFITHFVFMQ